MNKTRKINFRLVDTRDGHIKKIKGSGEVPEYCLRPDFGQMPAYLVKRNRRIQRELDKIRYAEEHKESLCKLISEEERRKLLEVRMSILILFQFCRPNEKYSKGCFFINEPSTKSETPIRDLYYVYIRLFSCKNCSYCIVHSHGIIV
jgi:hypothetical protein